MKMTMTECLRESDNIAQFIVSDTKHTIKQSVYLAQIGRIPRLTDEERLDMLDEDQKHALELIAKIGEEHAGLFADFTPQEKKRSIRPMAVDMTSATATIAEPKPKPPKIPKAAIKAAGKLGDCIQDLTGSSRDERAVRAATALCYCGDKISGKS